jgi:hypothetical protein
MSEREVIPVDEKYLKELIAGDVPFFRTKKPQPENQEIMEEPVESAEPVKKSKEKKRIGADQSDFVGLFLKENRLSDRRMVYVSKETYENIIKYISVISDEKSVLWGMWTISLPIILKVTNLRLMNCTKVE